EPAMARVLRRLARAVRLGEVGAAVKRVVGRGLETGLRADAGSALIDGGIQQLGELRLDLRRVRPPGLGTRRSGRIFRLLGFLGRLRHPPNMGGASRRGKGARALLLSAGVSCGSPAATARSQGAQPLEYPDGEHAGNRGDEQRVPGAAVG